MIKRGCVVLSVLGIDAAWTFHQPSGVALVAKSGTDTWRCLCVAPSYGSFVRYGAGHPVDWRRPKGSGESPDVPRLVTAANRILNGNPVTIITVDMPVSRDSITGRREADNAVSRAFGAAGCGTHNPSVQRPGKLGHELTVAFQDAGYLVATTDDNPGTPNRLLEVYPHPALLRLLTEEYRLAYKAGKSSKYWPGTSIPKRIRNLLDIYRRILAGLAKEITDVNIPLPDAEDCRSLSALKSYEDGIDALVCAWVGCRYLAGRATPFGNSAAAIWIPATLATFSNSMAANTPPTETRNNLSHLRMDTYPKSS